MMSLVKVCGTPYGWKGMDPSRSGTKLDLLR